MNVRRLAFAAKDPIHMPLGSESEDHVGALVHDPDVVLGIDAHGMSIGPGVEIFTYLADEIALGIELE